MPPDAGGSIAEPGTVRGPADVFYFFRAVTVICEACRVAPVVW